MRREHLHSAVRHRTVPGVSGSAGSVVVCMCASLTASPSCGRRVSTTPVTVCSPELENRRCRAAEPFFARMVHRSPRSPRHDGTDPAAVAVQAGMAAPLRCVYPRQLCRLAADTANPLADNMT